MFLSLALSFSLKGWWSPYIVLNALSGSLCLYKVWRLIVTETPSGSRLLCVLMIPTPDLSNQPWTNLSWCLFVSFTCQANNHVRHNRSKTELVSFPPSFCCLAAYTRSLELPEYTSHLKPYIQSSRRTCVSGHPPSS